MRSLVPLTIPPATDPEHAVQLQQVGDVNHREVVLHDPGTGMEPVTDADGDWLYGVFPGLEY